MRGGVQPEGKQAFGVAAEAAVVRGVGGEAGGKRCGIVVQSEKVAETAFAQQGAHGQFAAAVPGGGGGENSGKGADVRVGEPPPEGVEGVVHGSAKERAECFRRPQSMFEAV